MPLPHTELLRYLWWDAIAFGSARLGDPMEHLRDPVQGDTDLIYVEDQVWSEVATCQIFFREDGFAEVVKYDRPEDFDMARWRLLRAMEKLGYGAV